MTEGGDIKGRKSEARMMLACLQEVLGDVWGRMLGTPMSRYLHCAHTLTLPHSVRQVLLLLPLRNTELKAWRGKPS